LLILGLEKVGLQLVTTSGKLKNFCFLIDTGATHNILFLLNKNKRANNQDFDDVAFPLVELGWEIGAMINPIVYSLGDWKKREFTPFYNNVKQDGVLLWH